MHSITHVYDLNHHHFFLIIVLILKHCSSLHSARIRSGCIPFARHAEPSWPGVLWRWVSQCYLISCGPPPLALPGTQLKLNSQRPYRHVKQYIKQNTSEMTHLHHQIKMSTYENIRRMLNTHGKLSGSTQLDIDLIDPHKFVRAARRLGRWMNCVYKKGS